MSALIAPLLVLGGLGYIYRLVLSGRRRGAGSFSSRRARARTKPRTGNGVLMLAAVNLAALGYEVADIGTSSKLPSGAISLIVVVCLLGGVIMLVAEHSLAESIIGMLGFGAALGTTGLHYGTSGVLAILVLSVILLWFLGLVRMLIP